MYLYSYCTCTEYGHRIVERISRAARQGLPVLSAQVLYVFTGIAHLYCTNMISIQVTSTGTCTGYSTYQPSMYRYVPYLYSTFYCTVRLRSTFVQSPTSALHEYMYVQKY